MLEKFSVTNFKNFNEKLTLDFAASDYQFNPQSIKDGIVKTAIVYGANASGKSNLGFAILDIVQHLTRWNNSDIHYNHYLNKLNKTPYAEFEYCFKFGQNKVIYRYSKMDHNTLLDESLHIDDKEVLSVRRIGVKGVNFSLQGTENLNKDIIDSDKLSIIRYVQENTVLIDSEETQIFKEFHGFVNKMLFFRSVEERSFIGLKNGEDNIFQDIIKKNNVQDFQEFLNEAGIACQLKTANDLFGERLVFMIGDEEVDFSSIASSGTLALSLFYFWYQRIQVNKTSFVFIDEFDAFYHHNLSKFVVKKLKEIDVQVIFTTHNTDIMSNDLLRPDCYFILANNQITPINKLTDQELRAAHNLQKLYKAHAFE